ncbi:XapX domain-containing protein [Paraburkholderia diazotrophica]|uniref:XapX domain-containing protein n=1 Tax=Paraburkholderia diazotrophica TaxID=667676 RepID=A0A1H7BMW4_9BURK|nr:XapX domain-containing protein [Paraburkholderia diazotrophica]SEJ78798.1 XapX domain-containing protein [Paraburkholderia diazotrophica]
MKVYVLSLGAGILVGVIYSLLNVRSPAPPLVALVGLLGILGGEQIVPVGKQLLSGSPLSTAWNEARSAVHVFGMLPSRHAGGQAARASIDGAEGANTAEGDNRADRADHADIKENRS